MKCVLYARSRADTPADEKQNVNEQLKLMRGVALRRNSEVVAEFIDIGHPADLMNRPGLKKLLKYCRTSQCADLLLITRYDRLARRLKSYHHIQQSLENAGVRVAMCDSGLRRCCGKK